MSTSAPFSTRSFTTSVFPTRVATWSAKSPSPCWKWKQNDYLLHGFGKNLTKNRIIPKMPWEVEKLNPRRSKTYQTWRLYENVLNSVNCLFQLLFSRTLLLFLVRIYIFPSQTEYSYCSAYVKVKTFLGNILDKPANRFDREPANEAATITSLAEIVFLPHREPVCGLIVDLSLTHNFFQKYH